jgi:hypothetical protein
MNVPFSIPECGNEEIEEVVAVIKGGWEEKSTLLTNI